MSLLGLQRTGSGPVVAWLHGFTQTKNSAFEFRSILSGSHGLITLDLPGHGDNASRSASLDETVALLAEVLPAEPFTLGGYSLGARVALHFALAHSSRLHNLVLVSGTLGIDDEGERRARRERDASLAAHIDAVGSKTFLREWLAQPLFVGAAIDDRERQSRSRNGAGLADSLRRVGTGSQEWLGDSVKALTLPIVVVAGERDEKFLREGRRIVALAPRSQLVVIGGAGHAVHLDAPRAVAEVFDGSTGVEVHGE